MVGALLAEDLTDINLQDANGWAAIHWAVAVGATDVAKKLLAMGKRINRTLVNNKKQTSLHLAAREGDDEVTKLSPTCAFWYPL